MKKFVLFGIAVAILVMMVVSCTAPKSQVGLFGGLKYGAGTAHGTDFWDFVGYGPVLDDPNKSEALKKLEALDVATAYAQLAAVEAIWGFELEGNVTVKNYALQNKEVEKNVNAFVKGLMPIKKEFAPEDNVWVVTVRVYKKDLEKLLGKTIITAPANGVVEKKGPDE